MIKIKFNNSDIFHEVEFSRTENTSTLKGITEENTSGFLTYRLSGEQLGDFSDFITIYDKGDDYITFSNDGSVWVEPKPYEPTVEDKINALKKKLEEYDYIGAKIAMGVATREEYAEQIAYTETIREQIRELENFRTEIEEPKEV